MQSIFKSMVLALLASALVYATGFPPTSAGANNLCVYGRDNGDVTVQRYRVGENTHTLIAKPSSFPLGIYFATNIPHSLGCNSEFAFLRMNNNSIWKMAFDGSNPVPLTSFTVNGQNFRYLDEGLLSSLGERVALSGKFTSDGTSLVRMTIELTDGNKLLLTSNSEVVNACITANAVNTLTRDTTDNLIDFNISCSGGVGAWFTKDDTTLSLTTTLSPGVTSTSVIAKYPFDTLYYGVITSMALDQGGSIYFTVNYARYSTELWRINRGRAVFVDWAIGNLYVVSVGGSIQEIAANITGDYRVYVPPTPTNTR